MRNLFVILVGLSLASCSVEIKDRDGNPMTMEQIKKEGKAIERAINKEIEREAKGINDVAENPHTKESQTEGIHGSEGVSVKHNGKDYTLDEYVHIKMEWAYFQAQKEALKGDVRISNADGCWKWTESPWDGQELGRVLYEPECDAENTGNSYEKVTEEVNFDETYDPYDTDY